MIFAAVMTVSSPVFAGEAAPLVSRSVVNGTFVQLLEKHDSWSKAQWERLFDQLQSVGLRQIVVQWAVTDNLAFYPTQSFKQTSHPPLETILQIAEIRGIEVYIGLAHDSLYWGKIQQAPVYLEEYLKHLRLRSELVAREVASLSLKYSAFKGWYITEEIDDVTWGPPRKRTLLYQHIGQLSQYLKKLTPGYAVMLSAFSSNQLSPDSYGDFVQHLLSGSSVDILLFQDSIGTGKLSLEYLPLYLQAVKNATDAQQRKLQVVVELFQMISESPFAARPADMPRIGQQLKLAAGYSNAGIGSFSMPDYLLQDNEKPASSLQQDYQRYLLLTTLPAPK